MIGAAIGIQIITDPYVSDYDQVRRTWRERLFSWPWQPFVKFKTGVGDQIFSGYLWEQILTK